VFKDYNATDSYESIETKVEERIMEVVTPMKRKTEETTTAMDFPLTPPATIKSEKISYEIKIESDEITTNLTEHFVRRSKRRRTVDPKDNPFD
jgi:hypothetical protein